ncbi:MAG: response regulator transcription factor [Thermodesulfobacteriota bacterium]
MEGIKDSRILLVEDEDSLALGLKFNLEREGCIVERAMDGQQALDLFAVNEYDLIVLDIMLPYVNGFEVASRVRAENPRLPILILTARVSAKDRIKGLAIGADDYLTKPFHLEEFMLRVDKMLTRKQWYDPGLHGKKRFELGGKHVDFETLEVDPPDGEPFRLTDREAQVLKYLIQNKGVIVSRKDLLENVWETDSDIETRTVDMFIARLRKYFEADPKNPQYIKSVRGSGYLFEHEGD